MDSKTKGAWLLAQSKRLDAINGAGRLENIQYAGRIGRLYNLLRRTESNSIIPASTVADICRLNDIDKASRENGLNRLKNDGRIDLSTKGDVSVLGATTKAVLEATTTIFEEATPSEEEQAVIHLSEKISTRPEERHIISEYISDIFKINSTKSSGLIDYCCKTAILDQSIDRDRTILFNNNLFRSVDYAQKAFCLINGLTSDEQSKLKEIQERLQKQSAVLDREANQILGDDLYRRIIGVGLFDRLEVSNSTEAVGYLTSPDAFQKYGRPFEDDPVDDAKALLASLTYGMTRSSHTRGAIKMPDALLGHLINGNEVGGQSGVKAIGEDYRELEKRQVIKVTKISSSRFTMKLLKKDVGELARQLIKGTTIASDALLLDGSPAINFKGPAETRIPVRSRPTLQDNRFEFDALDRLRSGG